MNNQHKPSIALVGGTGDLGRGLARRFAAAGYHTIVGSRVQEKAETVVGELTALLEPRGAVSMAAAVNAAAAAHADIVVVTVPFAGQVAMLEEIREHCAGKIVIDVTVPLMPPRVARVQLPAEGSAAQRSQQILGGQCRVVSAFQNVAAHHLDSDDDIDCDVLVCSDDKEARAEVEALIRSLGITAFQAGSLANSAATEAMTSLLIFINKQYKCHAGIRLTGLERSAQ